MTQAVPEGFHTVTPTLTFKDSQKAIEFYKKAFNAQIVDLFPNPDGKGIMHATIKIGNSIIMMGDEMNGGENCAKSAETLGNSPVGLFLYVTNVDEFFKQAVIAGGKETMPVTDMFWGDRAGHLKDPFGYSWMIATHKEDLTQHEIGKRAEAFFASMAKK
ncbi:MULTISPECIES: VOC family protein [unclassified Legionella]|uniref:VOC family protein n=1 Tax=unclassified Legionella TaxID=2622702 RepID=UPI001E49585C|nr:VOC family protein [Legionella sp. 31fI33]MCC5014469.1 VOC family protein [Legionella sp. 31fI33]